MRLQIFKFIVIFLFFVLIDHKLIEGRFHSNQIHKFNDGMDLLNSRKHFFNPNLTMENQIQGRNYFNPYENVNLLSHSISAHHLINPVPEKTTKLSNHFLKNRRFDMDEARREAEESEEEEQEEEEKVTVKPKPKKHRNTKPPSKSKQNKKSEEEKEVTEKSNSIVNQTKPKKKSSKNKIVKDEEKTEFRMPGRARSFQRDFFKSSIPRNSREHFQSPMLKPSNSKMFGSHVLKPKPSSMISMPNSIYQPSHFQSLHPMFPQIHNDPLELISPFGGQRKRRINQDVLKSRSRNNLMYSSGGNLIKRLNNTLRQKRLEMVENDQNMSPYLRSFLIHKTRNEYMQLIREGIDELSEDYDDLLESTAPKIKKPQKNKLKPKPKPTQDEYDEDYEEHDEHRVNQLNVINEDESQNIQKYDQQKRRKSNDEDYYSDDEEDNQGNENNENEEEEEGEGVEEEEEEEDEEEEEERIVRIKGKKTPTGKLNKKTDLDFKKIFGKPSNSSRKDPDSKNLDVGNNLEKTEDGVKNSNKTDSTTEKLGQEKEPEELEKEVKRPIKNKEEGPIKKSGRKESIRKDTEKKGKKAKKVNVDEDESNEENVDELEEKQTESKKKRTKEKLLRAVNPGARRHNLNRFRWKQRQLADSSNKRQFSFRNQKRNGVDLLRKSSPRAHHLKEELMNPKEYSTQFKRVKNNKNIELSRDVDTEVSKRSLQLKIAERKALDKEHLAELNIDQIKKNLNTLAKKNGKNMIENS